MSRVISFANTIRNNWKKSTFAVAAAAYGVSYGNEKYEINKLMRKYCAEAAEHGNATLPVTIRPKSIIVILNPTANKRTAQKSFEEYCAPILHLAGISIEVVQTASEGYARRYVEELEKLPDAILIAGGDGTVSEAITGLLRRKENPKVCPVGLLPVGRTNTLAKQLFNFDNSSGLKEVEGLANAAIAIVRGKTEQKDVMKIEPIIDNINDDTIKSFRPIYAIASVQWGAFRDALNLRDKYWYFGPLREYTTFLFNAFSDGLTWNCSANLTYSPPCSGCNNCFIKRAELPSSTRNRHWWSSFIPRSKPPVDGPDYSKVSNPQCKATQDTRVKPSELLLSTNIHRKLDEIPTLTVQLGKEDYSGFDFILDSWNRIRNEQFQANAEMNVRMIEIRPEHNYSEENEAFFSIDNEAYEVKPVRVSVLPRAIWLYNL